MKQTWRLCAALALLFPLACGDDDGSSEPAAPFESTSVADEQKVASDLSAEELTAFCDELATYFDSQISEAALKRMSCTVFAFAFSGGDSSACNQAAQACIEDATVQPDEDQVSCNQSELADCSATIAELEACFTDATTLVKQLSGRVSCSMSAATLESLGDKPASCAAVEAKCPNLAVEDNGSF